MRFDGGESRATVVLDNPRLREPVQRLLAGHPERFAVVERNGSSLLETLESLFAE